MIFFIGPGGVGKTTVSQALATMTGLKLVDLDDEFCDQILNIGTYIRAHGYEKYVVENSRLCEQLILRHSGQECLIVLSSGFLSTDVRPDVIERNRDLVHRAGLSILLMPSQDIETAANIVVERQMSRGFGLERHKEIEKFRQRFHEYIRMGDIQVFSAAEPTEIATKILAKIEAHRQEMTRSPTA